MSKFIWLVYLFLAVESYISWKKSGNKDEYKLSILFGLAFLISIWDHFSTKYLFTTHTLGYAINYYAIFSFRTVIFIYLVFIGITVLKKIRK